MERPQGHIVAIPDVQAGMVRLSDGDRKGWNHSPYDEKTYIIEHEPVADNIARLDLPHWSPVVENPTDLWRVNRMTRTAPFWLRDILQPLTFLCQLLYKGRPSQRYRNYDTFMKEGASLACLVNLPDPLYEKFNFEWDMAGSIEVSAVDELFFEAGEIKSSPRCKSSLDTHPLQKSPTLTHFSIRTGQMATGAADEVAFLSAPHHHAQD